MPVLDLWFQSGESSLSVRRFSVHEEMSSLFSVSVWARSTNDDIDLGSIVGKPAALEVASGMNFATFASGRRWGGVCAHMELIQAESTGLSTYYIRIVPRLWMATQKRNHRIFQRTNTPDMVDTILKEWKIEPQWQIDRASYPQFEYRVQYGESDYAFISRMLEEAGICFGFADDPKESKVVLWDAPQHNEPRLGLPIPFVDQPNQSAEKEFVSNVRMSEAVRPGKVTLRDHDFRKPAQYKLLGDTTGPGNEEDQLEQYVYSPGAFKMLQPALSKATSLPDKAAGWLDGMRDKVVDAADDKVTQFVNDEVTQLLNKSLRNVAGSLTTGVVTDILGGMAGDIAGNVAGKLASDLLGGDRESFDIDFEKLLRDKMSGVVNNRLAGKVDDTVTKFVTKKMGKFAKSKLGGMAANAAGDLAKEATKAVGGKIIDSLFGDAKQAAEEATSKAQKLLSAANSLAGDDKGASRHDEKAGKALAKRASEAIRTGKTSLTFDTNALDLKPGSIFSIADHPGSKVGANSKLLITSFSVDGTPDGEWSMSSAAVFADQPYRPPQKTPKPKVEGLQSAVVVGPQGQEIHTDEFGRIRVQFHWDREGGFNDDSSRWMRVSQGWGGPGFGIISIPRVGSEVVVAFLEGDPDNPLVVGQVYNTTSPTPHKLPDNKTVSAWRGNSSPGGGGFNEILFEDMKGKEMLFIQAEKNLKKIVKNDETEIIEQDRRVTVGGNLTKMVMSDETETTGSDRTMTVGENLRQTVGNNAVSNVGGSHTQQVGKGMALTVGPNPPPEGSDPEPPPEDIPEGVVKVEVKERLELTIGEASLVIDKSGKVELIGVEFKFTAIGPVHINGSTIDLN
ncbi:MAG: type VI secretion system tip protein VgrG [Polyangiaceae bacterium]|nr:type VI secretion system tip protein VgrG [Polyangiaceae bacterium]